MMHNATRRAALCINGRGQPRAKLKSPFNYRIDDRILLAQQGGFAYGIVSHNLMLRTCTKAGTSMTYADLVN